MLNAAYTQHVRTQPLLALRKHNSGIVASGLIKTFAYKHSFCTVVYIFLRLATSGRRAPPFNVVCTHRAPAFNVVYTHKTEENFAPDNDANLKAV